MKKYRTKQQFLYSQTAIQLLFFYLAALQIFTEKVYPLSQHLLLKYINGSSPPASPCFHFIFFLQFLLLQNFWTCSQVWVGWKTSSTTCRVLLQHPDFRYLFHISVLSHFIFDRYTVLILSIETFPLLRRLLLVCQDKDRYASRRWYHSTLVWIPEIKVSISALAQYSSWAH